MERQKERKERSIKLRKLHEKPTKEWHDFPTPLSRAKFNKAFTEIIKKYKEKR